ncbi:hypothetical protein BC828DRAFT_397751 [Blastocladiella britannica]|nr:hypothetical protein BC828DRAFT_397751 [Blastocladiella britannica]
MAKPLAELVFNRTIDWFDDDSAIILHDISAALTFIHGRGLGHGALTVLDVWMVPRPVAVGGAGIGGLDFAVQAIVGGLGLGQYVGGVQRRLATHAQQLQSDPAMAVDAPDAVRAHIFARYLDPALLAHQQRHGVARNNNNNNEVDPLALLPVSATQAADLYSFGLLVYELVTRVPLLVHASPVEVQLQLASGVRPPIDLRRWLANASVRHSEGESVVRRIRVGLVELLTRCWANNAGDRPTAARVEGTMTKIVDEIRRAWGVAVGVARI